MDVSNPEVVGMAQLLRLCDSSEVQEGVLKQITLPDGAEISVCRVEGDCFAFDDMCTHGAASLSGEGVLEGFHVVCGWHAGAFDVRTGCPVAAPCTHDLRTYPVREVEGAVFLVRSEAVPA